VLVIGSDTMTSVLDYKDRATCVLFGDGAGAAMIEVAGPNEGILDFEHDVDGSGGAFLYMPGGGSLHPSSQDTVETACTMSTRKARKCLSTPCDAWPRWPRVC